MKRRSTELLEAPVTSFYFCKYLIYKETLRTIKTSFICILNILFYICLLIILKLLALPSNNILFKQVLSSCLFSI